MNYFLYDYEVVYNEERLSANSCVVGLSDKDVRSVEELVRTNELYGEYLDMPPKVIEKFHEAVIKSVKKDLKQIGLKLTDDMDIFSSNFMPAKLLKMISAETIPSIEWEPIFDYYGVASIEELWKLVDSEEIEEPQPKQASEGMKTLAFMQPWASLVACGIKDVELRDKMRTKCRKIFVAASGSKWKWEELSPFVQSEYKKYEAKGILPSYDKLPQKCIIGHVDIVDVTFDQVGSPWEEGHIGIRYVLRNAHLLDEPIYGKNKATPYFYNVEGYDEEHLPPSHVAKLD